VLAEGRKPKSSTILRKKLSSTKQRFKNIDDTVWKDAGRSSELDYIEQISWVLFLKCLDDFESDKETAALLNGES
jgi:type I restriction enzyme M protein